MNDYIIKTIYRDTEVFVKCVDTLDEGSFVLTTEKALAKKFVSANAAKNIIDRLHSLDWVTKYYTFDIQKVRFEVKVGKHIMI